MYGALDISTSGMVAQRTRMAAIAGNIANSATILDADGNLNPYRRREVMFATGDPSSETRRGREWGVHVGKIEQNEDAVIMRWMPGSPYANKDGYVPFPDINPAVEQINAMTAARAYEANVAAAETTKTMMAQALRLIS